MTHDLPDDDEVSAEGVDALRVPAGLVEQELATKSRRRRIAEIVASLTVTVLIFAFAIPAISNSDYSEIADQFSKLSIAKLTGLTALWILVMLTYTGVMTSALPGLKHMQALVVNFAGSAVSNVVPFGGAVGVGATYAMEMSWGFDAAAVTLSILVTGIWNVFAKLGVPIVALLVLVVAGETAGALVVPTVIGVALLVGGIVVFGLILKSEQLAARVGRIAERIGAPVMRLLRRPAVSWADAAVDFRDRSIGLLRHHWRGLTVWMLVYNFGQFLLLLACVRALGADTRQLGWVEVLAAFAFANLLTTIAITPSGVGFVEAGTVAALIAFGGPEAGSAAAVFLFRGFTYLLEIPLGAAGWMVWASRTSWRRPVAATAPG